MSVLNQSGEEQVECPLCLEPLEVDDLNFYPCTCGYQICRFCWHRIRTDENGLCPACRKAYSENPADFKPLSQEEMARLKAEKRQKDLQRKQKITENRKHLANIRVVQQNLVFVVGLPVRLADSEVLKKHEYFGKFGKIQKVVINQSTSYAGSQGPSASAYVTYLKADDALRAIQAVNNISVDGRTLKTSLGTTKYCSNFMKNQPCLKPDCMYLHELGDPDASFTKEEMQQGKHQEYEKKLHEQLLTSVNRDRKPTPSPPAVSCQGENSSINQGNQLCGKEAWPSLQPGLAAGGSSNGSFGLSNGTGNSNTNVSNNGSNTSSNNSSTKTESSQRKQRFDQEKSKVKNQKVKHTSGEESKGKSKEKCGSSTKDELATGNAHRKTEELQQSSSSFKEYSHDLDGTTHHPSEPIFGANDDADEQENDMGNCSGRQQVNRILLTNHTSTLFEPDNNSFFSTNNFTKVSAAIPGPGATDWLPLTHMPDVLPPVHSSEDWQAAFGFANSACPTSQHQENSCITVPLEKYQIESYRSELCSKTSGNNVEIEPGDQEQSQEKQSPLLEQVSPYSIQVPKLGEEAQLNSGSDGCLTQNMGTASFGIEVNNIPNSRIAVNPPSTSISSDISQHTLCHSTFVHDPTVIMLPPECHIVNNLTNHIGGSQHIISNGPMPLQTASNVFMDIHARQQSQHLNHSTVFESANLSSRISSNSDCGKFSVISDASLGSPFGKGQGKCIVNNRNEFLNGNDNVECILKDKYHSNFHNHQHKHLEPEVDLEFKCSENSPQKLTATSLGNSDQIFFKDGGRLTDDELGFDPFHETQKALAEMMEKENMMVTMQNQQPCYMFHNQQNHVNHLSNSRLMNSFSNQGHHILPQQNNRLPPNISSCTKLLNGLGIGPSSVTAARSRLPPPGFTTAPNHMNAFGLGIPRAPSSSCSKILPFMGLGNNSNCSPPPVPQPVTTHPQHQGVLFPPSHAFGLENASSESLLMKEWPDNFQPLLNSQNTSTPPPPTSFGSASVHGSLQKGWNGTDWTALDPAIVSSSCPPNFLAVSHSANLGLCPVVQMDHEMQQSNTDHCQLYSNSPVAPPPPGFSSVSAKNQSPGLNANMGNIEISGINETKGLLETNEEDQLEGLR